jgi:hypothetical protein
LLSQAMRLRDAEDGSPPMEAKVQTEAEAPPAIPAVQSLVKKAITSKKAAVPLPALPKLKLVQKKPVAAPVTATTAPKLGRSDDTSALVSQQLKKDQAEQGVEAPSAITEALMESTDGDEPQGNGFFGKYLKKHIDMKKAAEAKIQQKKEAEAAAEKERMDRMKRELSEKLKPEPSAPATAEDAKPVKKHKLSLSERAEAEIMKESQSK